MQLKTRALGALAGLLSTVALNGIAVAADRPYTEGEVVNVAAVRTEPGMFQEYMKYLAGPYKQLMEEQKKAGVIVDYSIYAADPRGPHDPDLYLVTVYKNMAALDDLNAKTDGIVEGIFGTMDQQSAATVQRGKLRTLIGSEYIRELNLK
jgi:L-rhamnose mutarotase